MTKISSFKIAAGIFGVAALVKVLILAIAVAIFSSPLRAPRRRTASANHCTRRCSPVSGSPFEVLQAVEALGYQVQKAKVKNSCGAVVCVDTVRSIRPAGKIRRPAVIAPVMRTEDNARPRRRDAAGNGQGLGSIVRVFHWSLATLFLVAYVTGDETERLHIAVGYAIAGLVALRIIWGLLGPATRFSDFVRSPHVVLSYLRECVQGAPLSRP